MTTSLPIPTLAELQAAPERAALAALELACLLAEQTLQMEHPWIKHPLKEYPLPTPNATPAANRILVSIAALRYAIAAYHEALDRDARAVQEELPF